MGETLVQVGRTDAADAAEVLDALAAVRRLLALCTAHVDKENRYVHPAIEARAPGASGRIADEHDDHLQAIADLEEAARVVEAASDADRDTTLMRLYRQLSLFVAENFEHMMVEETVHNAALWAHYTDTELIAIHDALLASIPPAEMMDALRWMVPSITARSRGQMFAGMRAGMPPPMFDAALRVARSHLDERDDAKLVRALGGVTDRQSGLSSNARA